MRKKHFFLTLCTIAAITSLQAQARRLDTTMKVGKVGYRVYTSNKGADKNVVNINPVGFENTAREASFEIKGRIQKCEVDDLNADGYPDLVIYVFPEDSRPKGTVIGITSEKNQGYGPIIFPDILDDPKIRSGYMGNDQFSLMEGILVRRFPVYDNSDTLNLKLTGTMRQVMYRVQPDERGTLRFRVLRSYDFAKP